MCLFNTNDDANKEENRILRSRISMKRVHSRKSPTVEIKPVLGYQEPPGVRAECTFTPQGEGQMCKGAQAQKCLVFKDTDLSPGSLESGTL